MSQAMELSARQFDQIGSYVREHLGTWIREISPPGLPVTDPVMLERIVRVEEELKSQRELMKQGFEAMEKRFEQVDKRFEDMNVRFGQMERHMNRWMAVLAVLVSIVGVAGPVIAKYL